MPTSRIAKAPSHDARASIIDSVRRLSRGLRLAAQETQAVAGVSAAQLFVLRFLDDGESASVSELAELTMTDRSSVASVIDRLLQAKLVTRATADTDRRRAAISITAKGRAVVKKATKAPAALLLDGLEEMSASELKSLALGLTKLIASMGLEKGPAYMLFEEKPKPARTSKRA